MTDLFEVAETEKKQDYLNVLPVSVMEIAAMGKVGVRGETSHDKQSSRSGYSPFPYEVAETCAALFLRDSKIIVDPFAGWGERADAMRRHDKQYIGFDLSEEAIEFAYNKYGIRNTLADSRNVDVPEHDGMITCPPYWCLEKYQGANGLDGCRDWNCFINEYKSILSRFSKKAQKDSTYCIATGDWRSEGVYYDLTYQTEKIMDEIGFYPFDKVVISRLSISKIKIMLPQAKRLGYTVKVHETLSVFRKKD